MHEPLVSLVCELIDFQNTTAERINQSVQFCANWLTERGVATQILENQGLTMAVATVGGKKDAPTVILNGHLDVVPGNPEDFISRVESGNIYGRGAYDMLGSVAAMMFVTAELANQTQSCNVMLQLVPDEEKGGELGTGFLARNGFAGDFIICGEPTNLDIAIQAKGVLQLQVEVPGVAAHGSRPWLGKNAILSAMQSYQKLEALPFLQESSPLFPKPSFNLAKIQAGQALNQVPDSCSLSLDIRYLPDQDPEQIFASVKQAVPDARVAVLNQGVPVRTSPTDPFVIALQRAVQQVTNRQVRLYGQDGSADTRFYAEQGTPAVEFGPVGANHHGPNEHVGIQSLYDFQNILKQFIASL